MESMKTQARLLGFSIALSQIILGSAFGAPKLDVGAEYRLRSVQFTNPTYGSEQPQGTGKTQNQQYYSQRGRIYLKGKFDPGIEIGTVLQSIGVYGSTGALNGRYPKEDFTPFIENMYVQVNEFHDWPLSFTVGRQPYVWGSGLLVSDDGVGFDGLRMDAGPFWGIKTNLFAANAKVNETSSLNNSSPNVAVTSHDKDLFLAGLSTKWGIHNIELGYIMEQDKSGSPYSSLTTTIPVTADKITRQYFDLHVNGRLEQGAFYNFEYALQNGTAKLPGQDIKLEGSALTFEGGFDFIHPRYRRMILAFVFMQGSGDEFGSKDKDEKFNPSFGHKFDGIERAGYGEFFAATPYSFYNEDRVIVNNQVAGGPVQSFPYTQLFSGLRMYGFRGSVNPWEPFIAGLEFYLFSARTAPDVRDGAPTTITETAIGRELVFSGSYLYAKKVQFAVRWGKFFPNAALNDVGASRLMFEASGRF